MKRLIWLATILLIGAISIPLFAEKNVGIDVTGEYNWVPGWLKPIEQGRIIHPVTVFAESEVISLVAQGEPLDGIVKGLHQALASRVAALARGPGAGLDVFMSGGVALNAAMLEALRQAMGRPVAVVPEPQLVGALGAALSVLPGDRAP